MFLPIPIWFLKIYIEVFHVFNSYGLLGPSGCGKTTLLHCILGKKTLDSGCVDLKANSLKDVGYMPQVNIFLY